MAVARADAVLAINMTHIAPWSATVGLMREPAASFLKVACSTCTAIQVAGAHTAPSNATFDADLRARDPAWGVRDVEAISEAGLAQGLSLVERISDASQQFQLGLPERPLPQSLRICRAPPTLPRSSARGRLEHALYRSLLQWRCKL